jgi:hypothetical protein
VTSNAHWGGRRYAPYAFTEQGVAMLSSVLNSSRAIAVNIEIMRAFVRMRDLLTSNKELAQKLTELERKISTHDQAIVGVIKAIRELMNPPEPKKRSIGFVELEEKRGRSRSSLSLRPPHYAIRRDWSSGRQWRGDLHSIAA